eukprot:429918-Lingulodinium_polyedra.AAC.1
MEDKYHIIGVVCNTYGEAPKGWDSAMEQVSVAIFLKGNDFPMSCFLYDQTFRSVQYLSGLLMQNQAM